jgi:YVTN family beta-propeller protein
MNRKSHVNGATVRSVIGAAALVLAASLPASAQIQPKPDYKLLVVHRTDGTLGVYQPAYATLQLLKTIPTGKGAREVVVTLGGKRAYVSNKDDHSISVVDLDSLAVVKTITDTRIKDPEGFALSKDGKKVYVALSSRDVIGVVSTDTDTLTGEIPVGKTPMRMTLSPDGSTLWVANDQGGSVTPIDTATDKAGAAIKTGWQPRGIAISPDGKQVLVVNVAEDTLSFIEVAKKEVVRTVGLDFAPQRAVFSPDGLMVFITGRGSDNLYLVDMRNNKRRMARRIPVGNQPNGLAQTGDGNFLYVGHDKDNTIGVVDVRMMQMINTNPVGAYPDGIALTK